MEQNKDILKFQWGIIGIFVILIALLIIQNQNLKSMPVGKKIIPYKPQSLIFKEEMASKFLYRKFPFTIDLTDFNFQADYPMPFFRYNLIVLFDFTVCGHCLHSGLAILKQYKEKFEDKQIRVLGIIGTVGKGEESDIISLKKNEEIFFPCKILPVDLLYTTFGLNRERFLDTPFYVLTSHEGQVLDIFKPEYLETTEFKKWIDILSRMDII